MHLDVSVPEEACPLNLAPTASTTATLAMGDALAVALLDARGFTAEDFARSHPGGSLGRRLLLHVEDVMRRGDDVPRVRADTPLSQGLLEMSRKGLGMTASSTTPTACSASTPTATCAARSMRASTCTRSRCSDGDDAARPQRSARASSPPRPCT